jgi:hypothetical protein
MISRQPIGGTELREMLPSMLLFVTHVRESKPSINDSLDCFNPCKYLSGSRKRLLWIFFMGLPRTLFGYDSLWVIVNQLTKVAHFVPVKMTYTRPQLVEVYMPRIVSDRET